MVPIMQKEIDTLVHVVWNSHRICAQKNTFLPDGIPNHIYKLFSISIWCRGMWHKPYCLYAPFLLVNVWEKEGRWLQSIFKPSWNLGVIQKLYQWNKQLKEWKHINYHKWLIGSILTSEIVLEKMHLKKNHLKTTDLYFRHKRLHNLLYFFPK